MDEKKSIEEYYKDFETYINKLINERKNNKISKKVLNNDKILLLDYSDYLEKIYRNFNQDKTTINKMINDIKTKILLPMKLFSYREKKAFVKFICSKTRDDEQRKKLIEELVNTLENKNEVIFEEKDDYKFYESLFLENNYLKKSLEYTESKDNNIITKCNINMINSNDISNYFKIFLKQTNSEVIKEMSYILYQIYNYKYNPEQNYLNNKINEIKNRILRNRNFPCMKLVEFIIEQKEKKCLTKIKSHSNLCKKALVKINLEKENEKDKDKDKEEFYSFYQNTTILEILNYIENKKDKKYIFEIRNGEKILDENDYNITLGEILKEKKNIKIIQKAQIDKVNLSENGNLTEKFKSVLKSIFIIYSNGKSIMEFEDIKNFLIKAANINKNEMLKEDLRVYKFLLEANNEPIKNKNITENSFLNFYLTKVNDNKIEIVWMNLTNLGYSPNLEKYKTIYVLDKKENMRYSLSNKINDEKPFINLLRENYIEVNDINLLDFILFFSTNYESYENLLNNNLENPENKFTSRPKNYIDIMYDLIIIKSIMEDLEFKDKEKDIKNKDKILTEKYEPFDKEENLEKKNKFFVNFIKNNYFDLIEYTSLLLKDINEKGIKEIEIQSSLCLMGLEIITDISSCSNNSIKENKLEGIINKWENYKQITEQIFSFINKYYLNNEYSDKFGNIVDDLIKNGFNLLFYLIFTNNALFDDIIKIEKNKNNFELIMEKFLLDNNNIKQLFTLTVKNKSSKFIPYIIDLIFSILKKVDYKNCEKILSNQHLYLLISISLKNNKNYYTDKLTSEFTEIYENVYNSIKSSDINNMQNQAPNLINNLKILQKFGEKNWEFLHEIINKKINNEKTLDELIFGIFVSGEIKKLTSSKAKLEKVKEIINTENKYISYNNLINTIKCHKEKELNIIKETPLIKELCDYYILPISIKQNKGKDNNKNTNNIIKFIDKFKEIEKIEQENITYFNSIINNPNKDNNIRKKYGKYTGLQNLGNTCYLNSIIQLLFMIPEFRFSILSIDDGKDKTKGEYIDDDNILHQLQKLYTYLILTSDRFISPQEFFLSIKDSNENILRTNEQKDSQEFFSMFCDQLEKHLKDIPGQKFLLKNLFGGFKINIKKCNDCNDVTKNYEEIKDISLDIKNLKNLEESLDKFISEEQIEDYKCDKCNKKVTVSKHNLLSHLPNYLEIELKRMVKNLQLDKDIKINSRFEFPLTLNMKKYCYNNIKENKDNDINYEYNLKAINVHIGNTEGGHFVSIIKDENGKWYEFDDKIIREFDINNLGEECFGGEGKYKTAYLLFYEKVNKQPIIKVLDENKIKEKQNVNIIEKNVEENHEYIVDNNIYLDKKKNIYYQFDKWDFGFEKNVPKEYFMEKFIDSKPYNKLLEGNCIHNLDNVLIKILLSACRDKSFNVEEYSNIYEDLIKILLEAIVSYYYQDNDNKINNEEKEKDIIFILEKIITVIIEKVKTDKNKLSTILNLVNDILFNKDNLVIIFSKDSVTNEQITKQMFDLLINIMKLNSPENNIKLYKNLNNIINDTKEEKEYSFHIYQLIYEFFKNKIIDKIKIKNTKNIFMPLYYKLTKEKNENNFKNISGILKHLIKEENILTKENILELKQVFNLNLVILLFNMDFEFLVILTKKLQYNDNDFSSVFNNNCIFKLYTYCEKRKQEKGIMFKLMKFILSILEIIDKYTLVRIQTLLGYPSLVFHGENICCDFGIHLMKNNDINKEIFEYINYNHIRKERCFLAQVFPSIYELKKEKNNLYLDENERLDLIYELISISLGMKENTNGNYFLFKYLYLMQSRCIKFESLYQEIKIILENANNTQKNQRYDLSLIKTKEIKCIEVVNYEKENIEYIITLSSGARSTVDLKGKKKYKSRPELPENFEECKEFLNEPFNNEYYGLNVNIVPYEIEKILISTVASNDNMTIFRFDFFTNYFTRKELLTFDDEKKQFSFDFIKRDPNDESINIRGDFEEKDYRKFLTEKKDFNQFLREIDEILNEKDGILIQNNFFDNIETSKKSIIRYFVLSKKKNSVLKMSYKLYDAQKDIEKNFYLPNMIFDCVEKEKDKNIINIHRIKHNFNFLEKDQIGISLSNLNYDKYINENFNQI